MPSKTGMQTYGALMDALEHAQEKAEMLGETQTVETLEEEENRLREKYN